MCFLLRPRGRTNIGEKRLLGSCCECDLMVKTSYQECKLSFFLLAFQINFALEFALDTIFRPASPAQCKNETTVSCGLPGNSVMLNIVLTS